LTEEDSDRIISLMRLIPTGVYKMSKDIKGLVQTSLNVAVTELSENDFSLTVSVRSSVESEKAELCMKITETAKSYGAIATTRGDYPGWEYRRDSLLRERMLSSYKELYGKEAEVIMIHAGLECGIFSGKLDGLDCVSVGPNHYDIHTPKERLSLSSTERTWKFLLHVMKNI
jgi:dipeptidase D